MTERANKQEWKSGGLKAMVLTGGIVATLAGARLLAVQEQASSAPPAADQVLGTTSDASSPSPGNRGVQLNLSPIPQVVRPRLNPVARSRSSR